MTHRKPVRIQFFWTAVRAAIKGSDWARHAAPVILLIGALFAGAAVWLTTSTQASHWVWKGWERMFGPSATANAIPGALARPESSGTSGNYTITVIDEPSAGTSALEGTIVFAVNASGGMTGGYSDVVGIVHGFVYADQTFTSFDAPNAGSSPPSGWFQGTTGIGIDTAGDVVGISADSNNAFHGVLRVAKTGAITEFDDPNAPTATTSRGTWPMAINDAGQIVGFYTTGNNDTLSLYHGFLYSIANESFTEIDEPNAGTGNTSSGYQKEGTTPMAINASGVVTGHYVDSGGNRHGFIATPPYSSPGNYTSFDGPGATTNTGQGASYSGTIPMSIDAAGDVVGSYTDSSGVRHGFIRSASGTITTFDAPGANTTSQSGLIGGTFPTRIDPTGSYIVGGYADSSGLEHGFVYYLPLTASSSFTTFTPPNMTTSTILPQGGVFGVNASGTVVGLYLDSNEVSHGFEYTPTAIPTISGISPNYGAPAALIEISGTGFGATEGNGSVTVGGAISRIVSWSNTLISITVPSHATTGCIVVTVGGISSNCFPFTFYPFPAITGVSPDSGAVGTPVTITGANLLDGGGNGAVTFNGTPATILGTPTGDSIQAKVPPGATTGPVSVHANGDTVKSSSNFTLAVPAQTSVTAYTYKGNDYGTVSGVSCGGTYCTGGPYALVVTFNTTLTGSALDNLPLTDITSTVTSFKLTDGSGLIDDNGTSSYSSFQIATDASGNIVSWLIETCGSSCNIQMQTNWDTYYSFHPGADFSETTANFAGSFGFVLGNPGTWAQTTVPHITAISPNYGAPAALIDITGTNFSATQGDGYVTVGSASSRVRVVKWTNTLISITVPSNAKTGNIVVTAEGETSNGVAFTFYGEPSITSLSVNSGPVGTAVTITGANLHDGEGNGVVTFNGTPATILGTSTSTSIQVTVPPGATSGPVSVHVNGVTVKSPTIFSVTPPQISGISPKYGAPAALIDITGTNFGATQGNGYVTVGVAQARVVSWMDTLISITVPSDATTGNIVVTAEGETSNGVAFTFYSEPSITSISTTSGAVSTPVTITGSNLLDGGGKATVTFNGTSAAISSDTSGSIEVTVPTGATSGRVLVRVNGVTLIATTDFTVKAGDS